MNYAFRKPLYKLIVPIFDILGNILFLSARFFKKSAPTDPKNILVVRLDHIGDFVCTTPLFKNLKKKFPDAKITVLINSASKELAYRDPNIDNVITFSPFYLARNDKSSPLKGLMRIIKDVRNIDFDLGIDSRGDLLSIIIMWLGGVRYRVGYGIAGGGFLLQRMGNYDKDIHVIDRNLSLLKYLNISVEDKAPAVYFNDKDIDTVNALFSELKINKDRAIVLHPFAGAKAKEWPQNNFQTLINRLKKDGRDMLLVGLERDGALFTNIIDMRGKLNLPQLAYMIKSIGLFIGLDSGPANIAATLNALSVILCSGTNMPQLWIPNNSNVKFVYKDIECKPCENKVCPEEKANKCMALISVDDVIKVVEEFGR